jgi:predicted Zn finger-like uncharacterized protein
MKITCPNCQKSYKINEARIPAGVKTVKCKACGHKMPLKKADAPEPSSGTSVIKRLCPYCGQTHALRQNKIPPGTTTIKCKSCARPVPLKLETAAESGLVHSLKKETSESKTDRPPLKAVRPPATLPKLINITCAGCHKKYKIPSQKIPPTAKALKCKACGQRIKLPTAATSPHKPVPVPVDLSPPVKRPGKKLRLYALAAGILLVVLVGSFAGLKIYKDRGPTQLTSATPEQLAASSALLKEEPFLVLNLNLPLILKNIDKRVAKDKKTLRFRTAVTLAKSLKLERVEVYLYADPDDQLLPVILARGSNARHLEKIFSGQESFSKYFERKSADKYQLSQEALAKADKYSFPKEPYQVTLIEKGAVFAPVSLSAAIARNKSLLLNTDIARFAKSIADPKDLARVSIRIPKDLKKGWEKKIQKNPALEHNPQAAMIAGMGTGILSQLTDSLKPVKTLALGFRFDGQNGRALSYAQQFRLGVDGNAVYQKLNSGDLQDVEVDGVIRALIELFQDQRYKHKLQFADNQLALEFSWLKKDDEIFLSALSKATFGQLFAQSMELTPTAGPVATEYTDDPHLFTTVDDKSLKPKIPRIVKQSLFPGNYWNLGQKPQMTLDLDPVNIPNAALAELTYEVRSIQSPDGKDILRAEENKFKTTINPGSSYPGSLSLSVKNGTPPESLGTAKIQFRLSLPNALQIFEFKSGDKKGNQKKSGDIQVTLGRLEKDVAEVTYSRGKSVRLIAYDRTGKALASRETISSPSSTSMRFQGIIEILKVAVGASMLECPFEIEVDLNGGQELKLTRKPEIPKRIRYNHHPVRNFSDFSESDLDDLAVAWKEAGEREWSDNLEIQLGKSPFSGQANWEVHFFGRDRPHLLTGNPIQGARDINYQLEKGQLANISAAFGIVQLSIKTNIKRLRFKNKKDGKPQTRKLQSGEVVTVSFNKNEISYSAGKAPIIQVIAYDSFGKRLKQGSYSSRKGGTSKTYFWGQPTRFELDLSTRTLDKKIPFDIKQRPLDDRAFQEYKRTIDNQRQIVATIKSVDRARRKDRTHYGDDLAGLYYLYSRKGKKPMHLFDKDIAHSDPAGQKRFGYKAKPYKGYYFTVLSGSEANGTNKKYKRRSKKTKFVWKKGQITTLALTRHPDLVAIPADHSQPTFFLQWGHVFMKPLNGETLKYLPENYYKKGWLEAKFIEE